MLINLKKFSKGSHPIEPTIRKFIYTHIEMFADEFDMIKQDALAYIHTNEGLNFFAQFLSKQGYNCQSYFLPIPATLLLKGIQTGDSPSYGIIIPDNDPKRLEWFLRET